MKTFTVDLTLSIDAMSEESADNKLDAFLKEVEAQAKAAKEGAEAAMTETPKEAEDGA